MKKSNHGLKYQSGPGHSRALHESMHKMMEGMEEEEENPLRGSGGTVPEHKKKVKKPRFQTKSKLFKETEEGGE